MGSIVNSAVLMFDMILLEFLTKGAAIDAETGGGSGLVIVTMLEHGFQHRRLDFGDHCFEQVTGQFAVQIIEIFLNRLIYRLL